MKKNKVYAIYRGDKFIDIGTKYELAEKLGVKPHTIVFYASPAYQKRFEDDNNRLIVIEIDDEIPDFVGTLEQLNNIKGEE